MCWFNWQTSMNNVVHNKHQSMIVPATKPPFISLSVVLIFSVSVDGCATTCHTLTIHHVYKKIYLYIHVSIASILVFHKTHRCTKNNSQANLVLSCLQGVFIQVPRGVKWQQYWLVYRRKLTTCIQNISLDQAHD